MCIALFLACKSVAFYKIPFIKQQGKQYAWLVVKNHSAKQTDGELEICVARRSPQDIGELMAAGYPRTRVRLLVLLLFLEVAGCMVLSS